MSRTRAWVDMAPTLAGDVGAYTRSALRSGVSVERWAMHEISLRHHEIVTLRAMIVVAQAALDSGDVDGARQCLRKAVARPVPDDHYDGGSDMTGYQRERNR